MLNHEYELTLIIRPDLDDATTVGLVDKAVGFIQDNSGTLLLRDDWGKRKLAYAIRNHLRGHYVLLQFASPAQAIGEVERRLRNEEPLIRFLTVQVGQDVDVAERIEAAKIIQKQRDEEARLRAAAEAEAEALAAASGRYMDDDDDDDDLDRDDD